MTTHSLPEAITDRYDIVEHIGAGGQGSAYRAVDRTSGQLVALKMLHRRFEDASAERQFARETGALERLRAIDGVTPILAHGVAGDRGWFATELFRGTLADRLRSLGRLDSHEVRELGIGLATTLAEVHDAGVLHRDLKPSNLFLRADGTPVVGDFGIAKLMDEQTLTGSTGASLGFVAPETVERGETSAASDIYGLGATLYALLEGHPPHADRDAAEETPIGVMVRRITGADTVTFSPGVPENLAQPIGKMLAFDPGVRPADARAVAAALTGSDSSSPSVRGVRSPRRPTRTGAVGLVVALLAVGLVVGGAIWFATGAGDNNTPTATSAQPTATSAQPTATSAQPTATSAQPTATPGPAPAPAAASSAEGGFACDVTLDASSVLLCETFDSADNWEWNEDTNTASISVADGQAVFDPNDDGLDGSSYLEQPVGALPPATDVHARIIGRFEGGPEITGDIGDNPLDQWWQVMFALGDESQNSWTAGVQWLNGAYAVDLGFNAPPDNFGGVPGAGAVDLSSWTCMELILGRAVDSAPRLRIDGTAHATVPDSAARGFGEGYVVRVGPVWLEPQPGTPRLVIDEVVVATEPIGC